MSKGPQFQLPNGEYSSSVYLSTTRDSRFYVGQLPEDADIVGVEVSVRGSAFTASPDLLFFTDTSFIVPNPEVYPDGLPLVTGENPVVIRATRFGGATEEAEMVVSLVSEAALSLTGAAPTNIRCESFNNHVTLKVDGIGSSQVVGYNFYASSSPGGGGGYTLVNTTPITTPLVERTEKNFAKLDADVPKSVDADGNAQAVPQLAELVMMQRDLEGTVFSVDLNEVVEIPTNVSNIRAEVNLYSYEESETYAFDHDRTAASASSNNTNYVAGWAGFDSDTPLYYVATALYYDENSREETESPYSPEIAANPTKVLASIKNLPSVTRDTLTRDAALSIAKTNPEVAVHPGSVIRDLFIDPFVTESLRIRTLIDFMHRATSFPTLLSIDDPFGMGESLKPSQSEYKRRVAAALHLSRVEDVQYYIDQCFEKLAANFGTTRKSGTYSRGEVTFYTGAVPSTTVQIPLGTQVSGGGMTFRTTENVYLPKENLASYYNPTAKEFQISVGVRAASPGTSGNVGAKQISSTGLNLKVRNDASTFGGRETESNLQLAVRAQKRLSSVDTGTSQGYLYAATSLAGVEEVKVVSAGDALMQRDYDPDFDKHLGGRVDIWIRGDNTSKVSDSFAFSFEYARDIQFELISNLSEQLEFRALDENLTQESPMLAMLDSESPKLGFQNASTGEYFDLTDYEITAHDTIKLSMDVDQPVVDYGDIVLGDYRYRTGANFLLQSQPVRSITSLKGETTGVITSDVYTLVRPNSPLTTGRSSKADAFLKVVVPTELSASTVVPTGELLSVEGEEHLITGDYIEYLGRLGALPLSIKVTSSDGLTEYRGPYDDSGASDYSIIDGSQTSPVGIQRTLGSRIADGESVLISYSHDENFTVTYESNLIVGTAQEDIDNLKHLTADVLVKETTEVLVNISATVITKRGSSSAMADNAIRVQLGSMFSALQLGDPIRQSDIIEAIDSASGVSHVLLPLVQMSLADGASIIREIIDVGVYGDYRRVMDWSTSVSNVYLLQNDLAHSTSNGGGAEYGSYVGVFKQDFSMAMASGAPLMGRTPNQAFIIGSGGMVIPGYSDDATIRDLGYVTTEEINGYREMITANRVLVSLPVGETPDESAWSVTYTTDGDSGASDLEIGPSSYFRLGDCVFTFDEDRPSSRFQSNRSY